MKPSASQLSVSEGAVTPFLLARQKNSQFSKRDHVVHDQAGNRQQLMKQS